MTMSTTMPDATDLGFVLHKHPDRAQSFSVAFGTAHVIWPEATAQRSTVALLLEVDPIALVRSRHSRGADGFALSSYVNDRPYAASSMLSVALARVFSTAMTGRCDARPRLGGLAVPLEVHVPALPSRGGAALVERLFAPLGWAVTAQPIPLDPQVPAWGDSPYVDLRLSGTLSVADALTQLYVLMPVLDDSKHYWVSEDEVDKMLRAGGGWLGEHPERDLITRRYLRHQRDLVQTAVDRLAEVDETVSTLDGAVDEPSPAEDTRPAPLSRLRIEAVLAALSDEGSSSVVDLGCGEGALLKRLVVDPTFTRVLGVDVSARVLELAARRLQLERMPDSQRARLQLIQSSAVYRDERLSGFDALVLMEVIEHVDPPRLPALERSVFASARPTTVLVTTPNAEHNVRYDFADGSLRHADHRFEWTRGQFRTWALQVAATHGYSVRFLPVGDADPAVGPHTQMAVFRRAP
ncbi:MAG TPA: 3' terminal RNA ribose 2'-O-methyltransferase Hen1 [Propionibacteriaceae bacterium]